MAMGITLEDNRTDLSGSRLYFKDGPRGSGPGGRVAWGPRIGIRVGTEHPWRAWIVGNPSVSASA
jgi:DNA-3-methyladenine glycosylase